MSDFDTNDMTREGVTTPLDNETTTVTLPEELTAAADGMDDAAGPAGEDSSADPLDQISGELDELSDATYATPEEPEVADVTSAIRAEDDAPSADSDLADPNVRVAGRHFAANVPAPFAAEAPNEEPEPLQTLHAAGDEAGAEASRRRRWPVVLALLLLVGGVYLAGSIAFMHYFLPNTTVNGHDVSLMSLDNLAALSAQEAEELSLDISGDGLELKIAPQDIKATLDGGAYAREAMAQQTPWSWPLELTGTHTLEVGVRPTYDAARLEDLVGSAVDATNKEAKPPVDAKAAYDDQAKRYVVQGEDPGSTVDKTLVLQLAREAIDRGDKTVELGADQLVKAQVTADDEKLNAAVEQANSYLGATQDLVTHDKTVATVDEGLLHAWVKLGDDLSVSFDRDACVAWAKGELSSKLDSVGATHSYTRPDGRQITISGGTYGWIIDGADIAQHIAENVEAGKAGTVELSFKQQAASWNPGGQEWGNKYIDIDLGAQYVRYYDGNNVIWEAPCVSGKPTGDKDHSTPHGVYSITDSMETGNVKLTGEIDPKTKKPEYISYVKYWMPFIGNSVALHDADWRSAGEFGGTTYVYNGSHGCVNLPPAKAAELYGMVGIGTVVVVHD